MPEATDFVESPSWRTEYAPKISELAKKIPIYYNRVKKFINNRENYEYVKGFYQHYRLIYLTECNRGENTGTQTIAETETALESKYKSRIEIKTSNLSEAISYLFGESLMVESIEYDFTPDLAKKLNAVIGEGLFECGCYRKSFARPSGSALLYLAPHLIEDHMEKLFDKVKHATITADNFYKVASDFFLEFLYIHPFTNGNGRTARLLISVILMKFALVPVCLFPSTYNRVDSNRIYLNCVSEAHLYQNYVQMNTLIIDSVYNTLNNFINSLDVPENDGQF